MAVLQLVFAIVGALLVVGAALAWRHGEIQSGGLRLRRGERLFAPFVVLTALAGFGLAAAAGYIATGAPPPRRLERGAGWELAVPAGFHPLAEVEVELPPGGRALGDGRSEVVVVATETAAPPGRVGERLRERASALALLAPSGERGGEAVEVRELDSLLELRWGYPSPRGPVLARALGYVDRRGRMGWVTATCTHEPDDERGCEEALAALVVTAADRLPLAAEAPAAPSADAP